MKIKNENNDTDKKSWERSISILTNANVENMHMITYMPSNVLKNQINYEHYDKYIDFVLSIKATSVNPILLNGIATTLIIELEDKSEFIVSIIPNYAIIDNKYYFEIDNYDEISKNYHDLFDINL